MDGGELRVLRLVAVGWEKTVYEVVDPEYPDETFVVQVFRNEPSQPRRTDEEAIAELDRFLYFLVTNDPIDPERILRCCNELINLNPEHYLARFNRGSMKAGRGDHRGALDDLLIATQLAPEVQAGWLLVTASALEAGRPDLALSAAVRATQLDSMSVAAFMSTQPKVREKLARLVSDPDIRFSEHEALLAELLASDLDPSLRYGREPDLKARDAARQSAVFTRFPEFPILPQRVRNCIAEGLVSADSLAAFSSGYLLARMHAGQVMHGDFHPQNVFFDLRSGATGTYEIEVGWIKDFEAMHAATDFQAISGLDERAFDALLIGYGKALAARDPSASFSPEQVFALVGVDPDYTVRVDPHPAWADALVGCLSFDVTETDRPSVLVGCPDPTRLSPLLAGDSRHCGALAVALAFLNYDATSLWLRMARSHDEESAVGLLAREIAWRPGSHRAAIGVGDPDVMLAQWLIRYLAQPPGDEQRSATLSASLRRGSVEGGLVSALNASELLESSDPEGHVRTSQLMDDILTLVDAVALAWDRAGTRRWLSQSAAQVSQILLRAAVWDPSLDESRELAMAARHSTPLWLTSPKLWAGFGRDDAAPYVLARLNTLTALFSRTVPPRTSSESVPYPAVQWSLAWRGLALTRSIIRLRTSRPEELDDTQLAITRQLLFQHRELLRQYGMALMTAFGAHLVVEGRPFTKQFTDITAEFNSVDALLRETEPIEDKIRSHDPRIEEYSRKFLSGRRKFEFDLFLPALIGAE